MKTNAKLFDTPFKALLYASHRTKFQINFLIRIMFENKQGISILNITDRNYIPFQLYYFMKEYNHKLNDICWIDFLRYDGKQQLVYIKEGE